MKTFNRKTGNLGENLAVLELEKKGYEILERNFQNRFGEIDIIARDKDVLVFVEVKSKIGINFGHPEEMINKSKLNKVRRMSQFYVNSQKCLCRIDVVAIILNHDNSLSRLTHYENVY